MNVKITKQTERKITMEIEIDLDAKSMLNSEENILSALNEAGKEATKIALKQFDTDGNRIQINNKNWSGRSQKKKYETPYGRIELERYVYQSSQGGKTYCPLEDDGRIIGQTTPKFAKQISSKYGDLSARKVQTDLSENHGRKISRNYIQKISERVGKVVKDKELEWVYTLPKEALEAKVISIGFDGTTSYLVKDGYRETMSGTIAFFNEKGKRVYTIYVAQMPEYGKGTFKERFEREIVAVKKACPNAHYTGVADGASDNWTFLNDFTTTATLDFWHAAEYLTPVSKVAHTASAKQQEWFNNARHQLRHEKGSAKELLKEMKTLRIKRINKTKREKLEQSITYFSNHHHQMNYAECIEKGLPIGSGITEAACKVIVKERLCCSGMMWKESGAQAVLDIRCLTHTGERWTDFWKFVDEYGIAN